MRRLRAFWNRTFDVRDGERLRTLFVALYLFFILFAYYVQRPVAEALFLNRFKTENLPDLYILIAVVGGILAYLYTKITVQASLERAVNWAMALASAMQLVFWWLIQFDLPWLIYAFNVWVKLFSIVMVTQGWVVASNVFNPREAKRVYGLLGAGAVLGSAFGGSFTSFSVHYVGERNLVAICVLPVLLAYSAFRATISLKGVLLARAKAGEGEEAGFSLRDIAVDLRQYRHLQVIVGIILMNYMVDVLLDFQFKAMAKGAYQGAQLTAFFGTFYGVYLNTVNIILQLFLTAAIVRWLGVGGTLLVAPAAISVVSTASFGLPSLGVATVAKLTDAASRYTLNRTGMELLYLPLPAELRNRTKAFVDIFVDRAGRGLGALLLVVLVRMMKVPLRNVALFVVGFAVAWIVLAWRAKREYVLTVRKRLDARRLDLESSRLAVGDPATLALVEQAARGGNARQACYALSLLADAPGFQLEPLLRDLAASPLPEVRGKVYELAKGARFAGLLPEAMRETEASPSYAYSEAVVAAVQYVLEVSPDAVNLGRVFLDHPDSRVAEAALRSMRSRPEAIADVATCDWISRAAADSSPDRRRLAAVAVGACGDSGTEALHRLLEDKDARVVSAAMRAAGTIRNRAYVGAILNRLPDSQFRGVAIEALAMYGTRISGTLSDILGDDSVPVEVRRQIPRVLKAVPDQRSVDVLLDFIDCRNLSIRAAVLRALNSLRERAPNLDYRGAFVTRQILTEARYYFELNAILSPLRGRKDKRSAAGLLASSIEERLRQTLERLFRLLGLRYPPKEIYAAWLAVHHGRREQYTTALEFLESVLDRELRRILIPLLDDAAHLTERGRELFGVEIKTAEQAARELIHSGDAWLAACAMAAAAELKMRDLTPDIAEAARGAGAEINQVALAAQAALA